MDDGNSSRWWMTGMGALAGVVVVVKDSGLQVEEF
jgi:hypothetical protein